MPLKLIYFIRRFLPLICISMLLNQAACSPIGLAVGAGASVVRATQTERGLRGSAEDLQTRAEVLHYLFQKNVDLFGAVSVSVTQGRVLLTGKVRGPKDRIEATKLAWKATGVAEVINELQLIDRSSIADHAKDIVINKSVQARLLVDENIKFINYTVDTVNGTVYLFGIAQNHEELERVIAVVRQTNYVENIVNYVTIKQ
tara:strand:- start:535 stop:1137 length:603 start_codon:yes stop_codon:yes gene_type:complete